MNVSLAYNLLLLLLAFIPTYSNFFLTYNFTENSNDACKQLELREY